MSVNQSVQYQDIEFAIPYYTVCPIKPLTMNTGLLLFRRNHCSSYDVCLTVKQRFLKILNENILLSPVAPLTFDLKINRGHLLLGCTSVSQLMSIKQRVDWLYNV